MLTTLPGGTRTFSSIAFSAAPIGAWPLRRRRGYTAQRRNGEAERDSALQPRSHDRRERPKKAALRWRWRKGMLDRIRDRRNLRFLHEHLLARSLPGLGRHDRGRAHGGLFVFWLFSSVVVVVMAVSEFDRSGIPSGACLRS